MTKGGTRLEPTPGDDSNGPTGSEPRGMAKKGKNQTPSSSSVFEDEVGVWARRNGNNEGKWFLVVLFLFYLTGLYDRLAAKRSGVEGGVSVERRGQD